MRTSTLANDDGGPGSERARWDSPLSANAQAWRRLAHEGYGRTAEKMRAEQAAADSHNTDRPPRR